MKPFIFEDDRQGWKQDVYMKTEMKVNRVQYYLDRYGLDQNDVKVNMNRKYGMLSVQVGLEFDRKVYFSYCQPYTYSMLVDDLSYV